MIGVYVRLLGTPKFISNAGAAALLTAAWLRKVAGEARRWAPAQLTPAIARTEGWTFGAL